MEKDLVFKTHENFLVKMHSYNHDSNGSFVMNIKKYPSILVGQTVQ